ncbi:MAG: redox-regulated ATPase YchF [Anaerolineae bacterium]|nr:redox-regulated ATPase YchF [Anaerolineae bacterium]
MELGIIGLPTSGKTTVFNALTHADRPTAAASTGKLELFSMVVDVPDTRVDRLSALYNPRKTTYAKVTYTDIAGLDQNLGKAGLSGPLRNQIAPMDAFVHVVRAFEDPQVAHPLGSVNPQRDLDNLDGEFLLADMLTVENRLARIAEGLKKGARGDERKALQENELLFHRLEESLNEGIPLRELDLTQEEKAGLRGYSLLTLKPVLVLLNTSEDAPPAAEQITYTHQASSVISMQGKLEMEISQLDVEEAQMFMEEFGIQDLAAERVIQASYKLLGLHSFFTVGEDEVRAWNIPANATAVDAAATIHTDLARGFIRAEVVAYTDLIEAGSMAAARKAAKVHLEGKTYQVQDGDIVHIRFSV